MERTGTPFGILLHGGDLLILQHQIHQSAVKRKTAAALLSSAAVLVANSEWTRDRCLTLLSELDIDAPPDRVRVVPLGADPRSSSVRASTRARCASALRPRRGPLAALGRAPHAGTRGSIRRSRRWPGSAPAIPTSAMRWSAPARSTRRSRPRRASSAWPTGCASSPTCPTATCPALYNCRRDLPRRLAADGAAGRRLRHLAGRGVGVRRAGRSRGGAGASRRPCATARPACWSTPSGPRRWPRRSGGLLDDPALRARLGAAGRRAVESHYNWDRVTADLRAHRPRAAARRARQAAELMPSAALAPRPPRSTTASTGSGSERQGPRALDLDWRLTHLLWRQRALLRRYSPEGKRVLDFGCMDGVFTHQAAAAGRRGGGLRHLAGGDRPGQALPGRRRAAGVHHRAAGARASSIGSTATRCWSTSRTTRRWSASWWAIWRRAGRWWAPRRVGELLLGSGPQAALRRGAADAGPGALGPGPAAPLLPQPAPELRARSAQKGAAVFIFEVTPPSPPGAR